MDISTVLEFSFNTKFLQLLSQEKQEKKTASSAAQAEDGGTTAI